MNPFVRTGPNCDVRLRAVIFESVGRFELAFRNILSETLSKNYGPHPYYDQTAFKNPKAQDEALRDVIGIFLTCIAQVISRFSRQFLKNIFKSIC